MSLFQWGNFTLHSGGKSWWRIDCDALTDSEIALFANMIAQAHGRPFGVVHCPASHEGSAPPKLVRALDRLASHMGNQDILVVDDVLSTGKSMEELRTRIIENHRRIGLTAPSIFGYVLFARNKPPDWVMPVFSFTL